jgi:DNA-binding NtrC family response regulator
VSEERLTAAVVDDEKDILLSLSKILENDRFNVEVYLSGEGFLTSLEENDYALVFLDVNLGKGRFTGIDILKELSKRCFSGRIIVISGNSDIATAVQALKLGAHEFLEKPFGSAEVKSCLKQFDDELYLKSERDSFLSDIISRYELIGSSSCMQEVRELILQVAQLKEPVLITGESGTGKELAANSIHYLSQRRAKTLFRINVAAITDTLIESQLFGYIKGAFSGAETANSGLFQAASGSSLFMDEIGELDFRLQAKLLRVIQEQEILPIGESKAVSIDTRCIFATNRNLAEEVMAGRFREDLFYRINTFEINMPPLGKHREDIPELAESIIRNFSFENNLPCKDIHPLALEKLQELEYPGNIRHLKNILVKALIESGSEELINAEHINSSLSISSLAGISKQTDLFYNSVPLAEKKKELEALYLRTQLKRYGGDYKATAEALGILVNNLYRKLKEFGITEL